MLGISVPQVCSHSMCAYCKSLFSLFLLYQMHSSFALTFSMALNSLLSFVAPFSTFWALFASTLLADPNTSSLVTSFLFLIAVNSHIISVIISLSFMLITHCSFSLLLFSFYLHSFTCIVRQPTRSLVFVFVLLIIYSIAMTKLFQNVGA